MHASDTHRIGAAGSRPGSGSGARRVLAVAGLALLAVAFAAVVGWWRWLNLSPSVTIPTPRLPVPNAREYYIAAGYAVVRDIEVDRASGGTGGGHNGPDGRPLPPVTHAGRLALLRENARALENLREGFAY